VRGVLGKTLDMTAPSRQRRHVPIRLIVGVVIALAVIAVVIAVLAGGGSRY
jgi:hypothetical protein